MTGDDLTPLSAAAFETLRQTNEHGVEYWSTRDLQTLLGYSQLRQFDDTIKRAMESCEQSGNQREYHFAGAGKPITGGKGAVQIVDDYHLSRFAGYKGLYGGLGSDAIKSRKTIPEKAAQPGEVAP